MKYRQQSRVPVSGGAASGKTALQTCGVVGAGVDICARKKKQAFRSRTGYGKTVRAFRQLPATPLTSRPDQY